MDNVELTTMCAIIDNNRVVMINREKDWPGWAFPGGHLEHKESLTDCIKREVQEETGLIIKTISYKGIVNFYNTCTGKRHIISNYIAREYCGDLKEKCNEGTLAWIEISSISSMLLAEGFEYRLPVFFDEGIKELYIEWDSEQGYTKVVYESL